MKKLLFFVLMIAIAFGTLLAQWSSDPAQNNAICDLGGEQAIPKVVNGPTGDTYFGWFSNDSGNYDVRLQRLDSSGNELWDHNGILISDNPAMTWLTDWDMIVDADNHAILTFQDIRNAGNNNIYAYRITPDGSFIWGDDGLELSNSTSFDVSPKVTITSSGNTVITWQADDVVIMQKIAPDGTLLWGANGVTLSCANTYSWPQPLAIDNDEILLKFFEDSGPPYSPTRHVLMQRFNTDGNAIWAGNTVVSNAGGISAWNQVFSIVSDENNGCFIAWHDDRDNDMDASSFIQHVNSDGTVEFTVNGVELSIEGNREKFYPEIAFNPATNELYVYWFETDSDQNNYGISGQKLDESGNRLWTDNGNTIIDVSSLYVLPFAVRQANDDVIILYDEGINAVDSYTKAMRLDADGNFVWTGNSVTMCSVASEKVHSEASQFGNYQIIAAWEDDRNGPKDIYAQNITFEGLLGVSDLGILEGTVTEFGSGAPIEGATVSITGTGLSATTLANGTYSISDVLPGDYDITCEAPLYLDADELGYTIVEGLNTLDFSLLWSEIAVDVTELICYLPPNTTGTQSFMIFNDGPGDLEYNITVEYTDEVTSRTFTPVSTSVISRNKEISESDLEYSPMETHVSGNLTDEIWDVQGSFRPIDASGGVVSQAGMEFDGTYFYCPVWNSADICKYDIDGNFIEAFQIPGVSGTRDLAYDGQYMYGGSSGSAIYYWDPVTYALITTINSTQGLYRAIAYDSDNDGFLGNNWSGDIVCTGRDGSTLYIIPDTGIASVYGMAYDNVSAGGPYLWLFSQAGSGAEIYQVDIASGLPTGVMHDVLADFPSAGIAGGLWTSPDYVIGTLTIGGLVQGEDAFMYELAINGTENWLGEFSNASGTVPGNGGTIVVQVTFNSAGLNVGDVLQIY
jgi:hypothetical protein